MIAMAVMMVSAVLYPLLRQLETGHGTISDMVTDRQSQIVSLLGWASERVCCNAGDLA